MCDEIRNPFPNTNGSTVEDWEWINISSHTLRVKGFLILAGIELLGLNQSVLLKRVPNSLKLL